MNLIQSFIYGGTIVSVINYIANTMVNPALASIIAAVPIGMVSMYFLKETIFCFRNLNIVKKNCNQL